MTDEEVETCKCRPGDVLFAASGEPGKLWHCMDEANVGASNFLRILRPCNTRALGLFLSYALRSEAAQRVIINATTSSVLANIQTEFFSSCWLMLPSLPEQTAIAAVLSDMDAELAGLEERLSKTRALKQGMMQELLTGRTRLV